MSLALGREGNLAWVLGIFQLTEDSDRDVLSTLLPCIPTRTKVTAPPLYIIYSTTHLLEVENA